MIKMKTCKKCGAPLEENSRFCSECGTPVEEAEKITEEIVEEKPVGTLWYYAKGDEAVGPFDENQMAGFINNGTVHQNTFVWNDSLTGWVRLDHSSLASYLSSQDYMQQPYIHNEVNQNYLRNEAHYVNKVNIGLYIFLTIITCSIFGLYWLYKVVKDTNQVLQENGKEPIESPGMALLYSIITCQIYNVYLYWKIGSVFDELDSKKDQPKTMVNSLLLAILGLVCNVAALGIIQDHLNSYGQGQ